MVTGQALVRHLSHAQRSTGERDRPRPPLDPPFDTRYSAIGIRMIVLHVITRLIQGGAQQNTVLCCADQVRRGHEVHLAFGPIFGPEGSLRDEATDSGATLHELPSMVRPVHPWHDWRVTRQLQHLVRRVRPDVVHTHSSKAGIVGRAAAWKMRVPLVIHTVHGLPFHDRQRWLVHHAYVALERWAARRCHHLIAITPAMVDAFAAARIAPPPPFTVIPSGVDLSRFKVFNTWRSHARREMGIAQDAPVVALLARLDELKGHDDLLDILPDLLDRVPGLRVVFIGDGWRRRHLELRVAREGFGQRVLMTGLVPHAEVGRLLCAADVKVLPSYQEGQSRTLVEALLCGCGVVAYDVGGIGAIVQDGKTGRLVKMGDRAALRDAILWMLEHPAERAALVEAGRAHVRERFDAAAMVAQVAALYERLLGDAANFADRRT